MRPTKYSKDVQSKADLYANGGYIACGDIVPSQSGLACELGVSRQTLFNWKQYPEFFDTLERIGLLQERITLSGGLRGELNSSIVKLLLANHGYSDRKGIAHSVTSEMQDSKWTVEFIQQV